MSQSSPDDLRTPDIGHLNVITQHFRTLEIGSEIGRRLIEGF